jgi:hypothetical protein
MTGVSFLVNELEKEYNSFPLLRVDDCIKAQEIEYNLLKQVFEIAVDIGYELGSECGDSNISNLNLDDVLNILNKCKFKVGDKVTYISKYNAIIYKINLNGTYRIKFWLGEITEGNGTCVNYEVKQDNLNLKK